MQSLPHDIIISDPAAMEALGEALGFYLQQQSLRSVFFNGNLGAGKTTLIRGILRAFGYTGAVKSPTYTLVEVYEFTHCRVSHFDLYRLNDPEELEFMGIRDYFSARDFCLLEWPEKGADFLPAPALVVDIEILPHGRQVFFSLRSAQGQKIDLEGQNSSHG